MQIAHAGQGDEQGESPLDSRLLGVYSIGMIPGPTRREFLGPTLVRFLRASLAILLCTTAAACGGGGGGADAARTGPPNVVFVLADDLGYGDLGVYGSADIKTPNLDRMAREGSRFTDFYTGSSVCSPSRAALLTGRYPYRIRMDLGRGVFLPNSRNGLSPDETTITEILRDVGYATAMVGKWHLGHLPRFLPARHGFDEFYGLPYSNDMTEPEYPGEPVPVPPCERFQPDCRPGVPLMEDEAILEMPAIQETLTARYTQRALAFMRAAVAVQRPFFLYYASHLPHTPLYASEDFIGTSAGGLYGDVVEELDWSVGQILDEIEALGVDENTLVIFSSDNGPWLFWATDDPVPQGGVDSGSAGPLRHGKGTTFEGGMRVPLIARWPGTVPAGRTVVEPAAMVDWLPTLAGLAGAPLPEEVELDGRDLASVLDGTGVRDDDDGFRYIYYRANNAEPGAYREGDWKLKLAVEEGESVYPRVTHDDLLFDLANDPGERNDLAAADPQRVAVMKRRLAELAAEVESPSDKHHDRESGNE